MKFALTKKCCLNIYIYIYILKITFIYLFIFLNAVEFGFSIMLYNIDNHSGWHKFCYLSWSQQDLYFKLALDIHKDLFFYAWMLFNKHKHIST